VAGLTRAASEEAADALSGPPCNKGKPRTETPRWGPYRAGTPIAALRSSPHAGQGGGWPENCQGWFENIYGKFSLVNFLFT
jgi:hypothetical protein